MMTPAVAAAAIPQVSQGEESIAPIRRSRATGRRPVALSSVSRVSGMKAVKNAKAHPARPARARNPVA